MRAPTTRAVRSGIEYLSPPAPVSMADHWFEIASLDHFWIRRRFEVLAKLAGSQIAAAHEIAEIGCGNGLLQAQIENSYGKEVCGFDLNEAALKRNVSRRSKVCCYDIFQREPALRGRFDLILLFDVLEHISQEASFLEALLFHLRPSGSLILNVPAGQWAYSLYDKAAGHVRRYTNRTLREAARAAGLTVQGWTYWGMPLIPSLMVRKIWLADKREQSEIIASGFDSRSPAINRIMGALAQFERIPQSVLGSSLMMVCRREA